MPSIICPLAPVVDPPCSVRVAVAPVDPAPTDTRDHAAPFEPSLADRWYSLGYDLGADGVLLSAGDAFPDATPREMVLGSYDWSEGNHAGYRGFARAAGYDAGLAGLACELPPAIPSRFVIPFQAGWSNGDAEAERLAILADYFAELDAEQSAYEAEREVELFVRQCGGWDRAFALTPA